MRYGLELDQLASHCEAHPEHPAFAALAEGLRKYGALDEAVRVAIAGTVASPGFVPGHLSLARVQRDRGDWFAADAAVRAALALDAGNPVALELLEETAPHLGLIPPPGLISVDLHVVSPDPAPPFAQERAVPADGAATDIQREEAYGETVDGGETDEHGESEGDGELDETSYADELEIDLDQHGPMLTESLAMLYHGQGHLDRALAVFDALVERSPGNRDLAARRDALRDELAAARPRPYRAADSGGRSVRQWLAAIAANRAPVAPPPSSFDAFYQAPASANAPDTDLAAFQAWLKELDR